MFAFDGPKVTDTAANVCTYLLGNIVGNRKLAVPDRLVGRRNRIMNKGAHLARLFLLYVLKRIEVLNFASKANRKLVGVKLLYVICAATTAHQRGPRRLD